MSGKPPFLAELVEAVVQVVLERKFMQITILLFLIQM
jgi:hypothetical protein